MYKKWLVDLCWKKLTLIFTEFFFDKSELVVTSVYLKKAQSLIMVVFVCFFQLSDDHDRTKESGECLKHLTQQAVTFQKKMNEIVKGEKVTSFAPLQVSYLPLLIGWVDS